MKEIFEFYERFKNPNSNVRCEFEVVRKTPKELAIFSSTKLRKNSNAKVILLKSYRSNQMKKIRNVKEHIHFPIARYTITIIKKE